MVPRVNNLRSQRGSCISHRGHPVSQSRIPAVCLFGVVSALLARNPAGSCAYRRMIEKYFLEADYALRCHQTSQLVHRVEGHSAGALYSQNSLLFQALLQHYRPAALVFLTKEMAFSVVT